MPEIAPIPTPETYSVDALQWMQHHGINPIRPPIRSSHLDTLRTCPLTFFLKYRCGIVHPFEINKALTEGGWFHTDMELDARNPGALAEVWKQRKEEVRNACEHLGIGDDTRRTMQANEQQEMLSALAWYNAAIDLKARDDSFLSINERFLRLGTELKLTIDPNPLHKLPVVVQIDRLLYDEDKRKVWIFDAKTSGKATGIRASTCSMEFQTLLYIYAVQTALVSGLLQHHCPEVPADATLGGMIHWIVEKPSIRLSGYDRDYVTVKRVVNRGRKNERTVNEKKYTGEPKFENHLRRVGEWMRADGEYSHLAIERRSKPVVEFSWTHYNGEPLQDNAWFMEDLHYLEQYSYCKPVPAVFPPNPQHLRGFSNPSPYLRFAANHPVQWPAIFLQDRFVIDHRN